MGCGSSKQTAVDEAPRASGAPIMPEEQEFFDAVENLTASPSFMRAKSLDRLKNAADEPAPVVKQPSLIRWISAIGPKVEESVEDSGMSKCVVPLYERGMETLAQESSNASWTKNVDGVGFKLRGKTYKKDKKKIPSEAPFYDVQAVLSFKSEEKVGDWIKHLFDGNLGTKIRDEIPTVIIVNIMIPNYKPSGGLLAKKEHNGPGHNVVLLCKISDFAQKTLKETEDWDDLPPDFKLLRRYVKGDGTGKVDVHPHAMAIRQQTKMVVMVVTGHEHLPWLVRQAVNHGNGKPFMVNRTSSYIERSGALEINVDAHNFSNVALNGLRTVHTSLGKLILDVGATIQGENEAELPERLLFSCRVNYPKIEKIEAHVDMLEANRAGRKWLGAIQDRLA